MDRIDGLPNVIAHLVFSPDGRYLVACLGDANGIRVYETEGFGEVAADPDYGADSYWAAFDRQRRLVTSSYDGKIRLYDPDFRLIETHEAPGGERPFAVAFSPDGARIAVGYGDSTKVDVLDGRTLAPVFAADTAGIDNGSLGGVAWSADGKHLYASGTYGTAGYYPVRIWSDGDRGGYEEIALGRDTTMALRPLADGRLAFGAADPTPGRPQCGRSSPVAAGPGSGGLSRSERDVRGLARRRQRCLRLRAIRQIACCLRPDRPTSDSRSRARSGARGGARRGARAR